MKDWPVPGGHLDRLGLRPEEIESRSRRAAGDLVAGLWEGDEAALAASVSKRWALRS